MRLVTIRSRKAQLNSPTVISVPLVSSALVVLMYPTRIILPLAPISVKPATTVRQDPPHHSKHSVPAAIDVRLTLLRKLFAMQAHTSQALVNQFVWTALQVTTVTVQTQQLRSPAPKATTALPAPHMLISTRVQLADSVPPPKLRN